MSFSQIPDLEKKINVNDAVILILKEKGQSSISVEFTEQSKVKNPYLMIKSLRDLSFVSESTLL
jgi:hypothetical protein